LNNTIICAEESLLGKKFENTAIIAVNWHTETDKVNLMQETTWIPQEMVQ
jgi:hypothetical protein